MFAGGVSFLGKTNFAGVTYITPFQLVFRGRMAHNGISAGNRPGAKSLGGNMSEQWFEVIDRGVIVFAGPLQSCGDFVAENNNNYAYGLIIRPVTF